MRCFCSRPHQRSGPAVTCLERFEQGRFQLAVSQETLSELHVVLSRSGLRKSFHLLTKERADRLVALLVSKGKLFRNVPRGFAFPRDPDDEPYVNLAIDAAAEFLVTRDRDLLDLMSWTTREGRDFQNRFKGLKILDPVAFLSEIDQG